MNNQAAQTMPGDLQWKIDTLNPSSCGVVPLTQEEWAYVVAALSQPAGVDRYAEGVEAAAAWLDIVRDEFCEEHGHIDPDTNALTFGRGRIAESKDEFVATLAELAEGVRKMAALEWRSEAKKAALAAAPAASGGEDAKMKRSDCDDPTCGCKDPAFTEPMEALEFLSGRFKYAGISHAVARSYARDIDAILAAHPPSGASVSERARALLATEYKAHSFHRLNAIGDAILAGELMREGEIACALRAIERALSSPRQEGEAVAEVVYDLGWNPRLIWHSNWALQNPPPSGTKLYAHPSTAASTQGLLQLADEIDRQARECPTVDWRPNAHENARRLRALLTSPTTGADGGSS